MLWQYCYTCSQIAGSRKDSTGIHDEMAQSVCNRKHAQERTVAPTGTESCASLLNRKQVTESADPNSVRDTPRLRGQLLSGSTRHTVSVHVPVHDERQTTANEPKTFNNIHYTHTHTHIQNIILTRFVFPQEKTSFSYSVLWEIKYNVKFKIVKRLKRAERWSRKVRRTLWKFDKVSC